MLSLPTKDSRVPKDPTYLFTFVIELLGFGSTTVVDKNQIAQFFNFGWTVRFPFPPRRLWEGYFEWKKHKKQPLKNASADDNFSSAS